MASTTALHAEPAAIIHFSGPVFSASQRPLPVSDAARALALPVLVHPRAVPEPALARELTEMGEQDQALRHAWDGKPDSALARRGFAELLS